MPCNGNAIVAPLRVESEAREKMAKALQRMPCNGNAIVAPPRGEAEAREKIAKALQKMPSNGNAIVAPPRGEAEARRKVNTQMGVEDVHHPNKPKTYRFCKTLRSFGLSCTVLRLSPCGRRLDWIAVFTIVVLV